MVEREIHVEEVAIEAKDEKLEVVVAYRRRGRGAAGRALALPGGVT